MFISVDPKTELIFSQEYLNRPTAPAAWWAHPNGHVLGGRDLLRDEKGTWLGVTSDGRLAVLTNFREEGQAFQGARSRGAMVNAFLKQAPQSAQSTEDFVKTLVEDKGVSGVGGFSLVCGKIGASLAVVSNRTPNVQETPWIAAKAGETIGLSNAAFGNRSWPKVMDGEKLMASTIQKSLIKGDSKNQFIEELMHLLSIDTLPRCGKEEGWESYISQLRKSIFIPILSSEDTKDKRADTIASAKHDQQIERVDSSKGTSDKLGTSGLYGTQKQTVLLVDYNGHATFVERTLYDQFGQPLNEEHRDLKFEFDF